MNTQPQLMNIALNPADVVYTPDNVARDVVDFFKPTGRILEPCSGDGAFLKYLPGADWCEIEKGRDFFAEHRHFDWIVGNPPFSIFTDWLTHSFEIADNVVYVMMFSSLVNSITRLRQIQEYGGVKTNFILGTAREVGMTDFGYTCSAVHFQRNYRGGMLTVFR
jgi:hypothetical protein